MTDTGRDVGAEVDVAATAAPALGAEVDVAASAAEIDVEITPSQEGTPTPPNAPADAERDVEIEVTGPALPNPTTQEPATDSPSTQKPGDTPRETRVTLQNLIATTATLTATAPNGDGRPTPTEAERDTRNTATETPAAAAAADETAPTPTANGAPETAEAKADPEIAAAPPPDVSTAETKAEEPGQPRQTNNAEPAAATAPPPGVSATQTNGGEPAQPSQAENAPQKDPEPPPEADQAAPAETPPKATAAGSTAEEPTRQPNAGNIPAKTLEPPEAIPPPTDADAPKDQLAGSQTAELLEGVDLEGVDLDALNADQAAETTPSRNAPAIGVAAGGAPSRPDSARDRAERAIARAETLPPLPLGQSNGPTEGLGASQDEPAHPTTVAINGIAACEGILAALRGEVADADGLSYAAVFCQAAIERELLTNVTTAELIASGGPETGHARRTIKRALREAHIWIRRLGRQPRELAPPTVPAQAATGGPATAAHAYEAPATPTKPERPSRRYERAALAALGYTRRTFARAPRGGGNPADGFETAALKAANSAAAGLDHLSNKAWATWLMTNQTTLDLYLDHETTRPGSGDARRLPGWHPPNGNVRKNR